MSSSTGHLTAEQGLMNLKWKKENSCSGYEKKRKRSENIENCPNIKVWCEFTILKP